jgi:polyribonucleotide nucleotidyltransferase
MDIKVKGIAMEVLKQALTQALEARLFILDKIKEALPEPREQLSQWAPRMYRIQIPAEKIGTVIGPGGRVIRSIIEETKCSIDVQDDGTVFIGSSVEEGARKAIEVIEGLTKDIEIGDTFNGKVTRIVDFGAFVELPNGKDGLVRIGELADYHVPSVEEVVSLGDEIMVKVIEIDNMGRINLSRRALLSGSEEGESDEGQPAHVTSDDRQPSREEGYGGGERRGRPQNGGGRSRYGGGGGGGTRGYGGGGGRGGPRREGPPRRGGGGNYGGGGGRSGGGSYGGGGRSSGGGYGGAGGRSSGGGYGGGGQRRGGGGNYGGGQRPQRGNSGPSENRPGPSIGPDPFQ